MPLSHEESIKKLRDQVARGRPIIGAGAGTGISANSPSAARSTLLFIIRGATVCLARQPGRYLPYGDANAIVVEMGTRCCRVSIRRCWRAYAAPTRFG